MIQKQNRLRFCCILFFALLLGGMGFFAKEYLISARIVPAGATVSTAAVQYANATPEPLEKTPLDLEMKANCAEASKLYGFQCSVTGSDGIIEMYDRQSKLQFGDTQDYTSVNGITTFASSPFRNSFCYGTRSISEKQLTRIWEQKVGTLQTSGGDVWQGTGWTGMPLIVKWDAQVRKTLGIQEAYKQDEDFTEVIYPATDGKIYFLDLKTGMQTRTPIQIGVVMKGTALLDPRGYPILYVGQGVEDKVDGRGAWVRAVSLIENKVIWSFGGTDPDAYRNLQAYDGSGLIDAGTDTLLLPGENGIVYSTVLHSNFDAQAGKMSISPEPLIKYRYTADEYGTDDGMRTWGIESSITAFGEYAFFTDNGGFLQCVDLNHMRLVYAVDLVNESDATVVLSEEDEDQYLYTATLSGTGSCAYMRKHEAQTGAVLWENCVETVITEDSTDTRGALGTPHAGHGNISDLVIFNATMTPYEDENGEIKRGGCVLALSKSTGEEKWRYDQEGGCWSSPVVIYDENENAYVIQCDRTGYMRLLNAQSGELLFSLDLGSRIESTPAVFNDTLVVGTRGQYGSGEGAKIIGVKIG